MAWNEGFAKNQLEKLGWTEGSGLGRSEQGIKEAIKVKIKNDTAGVGHDRAEEFTFHWWDHVFNKAASSIKVKQAEDSVSVVKESESGPISSRKAGLKTFNNKQMLYGRFIKSATLTGNGETIPEEKDESSSSESEDEMKTAAVKCTDEAMFKKCGGRTAHKGARHGLGLSGKLARIEEQEKHFSLNGDSSGKMPDSQSSEENNSASQDSSQEESNKKKHKKSKKCKRKKSENLETNECDIDTETKKHKKCKKRKNESDEFGVHRSEPDECEIETKREKKSNKRENETVENGEINLGINESKMKTGSKKEKKSKKREIEAVENENDNNDESVPVKKVKKSKKQKKRKNDDDSENECDWNKEQLKLKNCDSTINEIKNGISNFENCDTESKTRGKKKKKNKH